MTPLALTIGDPAGIGPELVLQILVKPLAGTVPCAFGSAELLRRVSETTGYPLNAKVVPWEESLLQNDLDVPTEPTIFDIPLEGLADLLPGAPTALSGKAAYHWLLAGIRATEAGLCGAVITAPLCKEALYLAGKHYDGHTEILVEETKTKQHAMMLSAPAISASLVTTHMAVAEVSKALTIERICEVTRLTAQALPLWKESDGPPRLAMLGLNPHAGENGLFGDEEQRIIEPALKLLREEGHQIVGPLSADTAFIESMRSEVDGYIAMYHDQGLIPLKTLAFDEAVNVTLGLPIVRTSVDHGTAFPLAWKGKAQVTSLYAACDAAMRLVGG